MDTESFRLVNLTFGIINSVIFTYAYFLQVAVLVTGVVIYNNVCNLLIYKGALSCNWFSMYLENITWIFIVSIPLMIMIYTYIFMIFMYEYRGRRRVNN